MRISHPIRPGAFIFGAECVQESLGWNDQGRRWEEVKNACFFWHFLCGSIWFFFGEMFIHFTHCLNCSYRFWCFGGFLIHFSFETPPKDETPPKSKILKQEMMRLNMSFVFNRDNVQLEHVSFSWMSPLSSWMSPLSSWCPHWVHSVPRSSRVVALSKPPWIRVQQSWMRWLFSHISRRFWDELTHPVLGKSTMLSVEYNLSHSSSTDSKHLND